MSDAKWDPKWTEALMANLLKADQEWQKKYLDEYIPYHTAKPHQYGPQAPAYCKHFSVASQSDVSTGSLSLSAHATKSGWNYVSKPCGCIFDRDIANWDPVPWITPDTWSTPFIDFSWHDDKQNDLRRLRLRTPDGEWGIYFSLYDVPENASLSLQIARHVRDLAKKFSVADKAYFWSKIGSTQFDVPQKPYSNHVGYNPAGYPMFENSLDVVSGDKIKRDLEKVVPGLRGFKVVCPSSESCATKFEMGLLSVIPHLNDLHHWSREEIADWLEALDADLAFV